MELVADHPAYPEPHDCVFAHRDKMLGSHVETTTPSDDGVEL